MVTLDTSITREVAIAFDLSRMAGVARLGLARFPLRSDNRIDLGLREVGDRSRGCSRHVGAVHRRRKRHGRLVWGRHWEYLRLSCHCSAAIQLFRCFNSCEERNRIRGGIDGIRDGSKLGDRFHN